MKGILKLGMKAVLIASFGPLQVSEVNCTGKASVQCTWHCKHRFAVSCCSAHCIGQAKPASNVVCGRFAAVDLSWPLADVRSTKIRVLAGR